MFTYAARTFDELATPPSRNKIFVLVEITDSNQARQLELSRTIMGGLGLSSNSWDSLETALDRGYLVAETQVTKRGEERALSIVDYFRQRKLRDIVRVYLFINEQLVENSRDGLPSTYDLISELPPQCYAIR